jgi:Fungal N-terminal domain of STAND proteins
MDPLSITASVITVASLAASIGKEFTKLRTLCRSLPGRLHALNNEVTDLEVVLHQVASVIEQRATDSVLKDQEASIAHLLTQATVKLYDLRLLIVKLTDRCEQVKNPILLSHIWRKDQSRLQVLQEDIKTIKSSLNIMLGASNS